MLYRDKFYRVLSLAVYLADGRHHKVQEMMDRFGVSKATMNRDVFVLESIGIALERDRQKGIRLMPDVRLFIPQMHAEEALAMQIAMKFLPSLPGLSLVERGSNAWGKVIANLSERLKNQVAQIDGHIYSLAEAPLEKPINPAIFQRLLQAIADRQCVIITYDDQRSSNTERKLEPCRIVIAKGRLFLFAFCLLRQEFRIFRLDRIQEVRASSEIITPNREQAAQVLLDAAWGVEISAPRCCRIIFYGDSARAAKERRWHISQVCRWQENGSLEFTVTTGSTVEIGRWLLSFGGEVEVLEPPELKAWYQGQVTAMWKRLNFGRS